MEKKMDKADLRFIAWELTQSCNLNCLHCRGSATSERNQEELSFEECRKFLDEVKSFAEPVIILSGGEPLKRPDVFEIAEYGTFKGLRVVLATNGTLLSDVIAKDLKKCGIKRVSISLDGSTDESHDTFRGIKGGYDRALAGIENLKSAGLPFQVNTTITRRNLDDLEQILENVIKLGAAALHIFLLVPTGRGKLIEDEEIAPDDYERVLEWFYNKQTEVSIGFKATCAPHYFRIASQKGGLKQMARNSSHGFEAMSRGCLGGISFCFVSYRGEVYPCGYLPLLCGNIRENNLENIWNRAEIFNNLRDYDKLKGKCGICEFKRLCGGCRARAYAAVGDYLAEEPYCIYKPKQQF
ncbi:MAG: heme b synthase [bacterium]